MVGPAAAAVVPPGTVEIDLRGKTIMPGLIDCHDHLVHTGFDLMQRARRPAEPDDDARSPTTCGSRSRPGITTVRDAGGLDVGFKMAVEEGMIPGPRLVLGL